MKHTNIIQIIDSLSPGGAEMMAVNIANSILEYGYGSHICVTRFEGGLKEKLDSNLGYCFLNKRHSFDFVAFYKLIKYVNTHNISLIHAHSSSFFIASIMKYLNPKIQIIWHDHYGKSEELNKRPINFIKFLSKKFKAIVAVNNKLKNWAINSLDCEDVVYLPNFANIQNQHQKKTFLRGLENKRIISLANLRPQKDHLNLLRAFQLTSQTFPEWTLHLVGIDFKDDYSKEIKHFVDVNNLKNRVFIYGQCKDINHILSQVDIGVLSSNSEGLPLALLEYGLATLPVVTTNVGDCNKVILNEETGLLVSSDNSNELATKLLYLINNLDNRDKLSQNLNKHVTFNFSKEKYIANLLEIYNA